MIVEHHSFLIRIWRDTNSNLTQHGEWHGEVEHIQSGCQWTFDEVEQYLALIKVNEHDIGLIENFNSKTESTTFTQP